MVKITLILFNLLLISWNLKEKFTKIIKVYIAESTKMRIEKCRKKC